MSKAFTLIELLAVTSIILLLTALTLPNYKSGKGQLALQRSAFKLVQDLRRAQEMALSSIEINGETPYGFGIYFDPQNTSRYILFANADNDYKYDSDDINMEVIAMESGVEILTLDPAAAFSVLFTPPDPEVWIKGELNKTAKITLSLKGVISNVKKTIFINSAGLIAAD